MLNLGPKTENVPAERATELYRAVRETVKFFEADVFAVPESGHDAAAFSAEVNAEVALGFHRFVAENLTISLPFLYRGKHFFGYYGLL